MYVYLIILISHSKMLIVYSILGLLDFLSELEN